MGTLSRSPSPATTLLYSDSWSLTGSSSPRVEGTRVCKNCGGMGGVGFFPYLVVFSSPSRPSQLSWLNGSRPRLCQLNRECEDVNLPLEPLSTALTPTSGCIVLGELLVAPRS